MSRNKKNSVVKRLFSDMGNTRKTFYIVIFVIAISKLFLAIAPRLGGKITDMIVSFAKANEFDMPLLIKMCLVLAFMYLIGNGAEIIIRTQMMKISQ